MKPSKFGGLGQTVRLDAVGWMLPARCRLCDMPSRRNIDLCLPCEGELPWQVMGCQRCALPLPVTATACAHCLSQPPAFDACVAACGYTAPVSDWVKAAKHAGDFSALAVLSQLLYRAVDADLSVRDAPDFVCPMPLHWQRRWRRGFNQAAELANRLGDRLPVRVTHQLARRIRATSPQQSLDAAARRRNLAGAFRVKANLSGRSIAIVDDVLTTGASAHALARALKAAGAREVRVWCCARTPDPASVQ